MTTALLIALLFVLAACGGGNLIDDDPAANGIYIDDILYDDLFSAITAAEGTSAVITIYSKIDRGISLSVNAPLEAKFPDNTHITIEGKGPGKCQIHCNLYYYTQDHSFFKITDNSSLTLKNIRLNGGSRDSVISLAGGTLTMLEDAIITGSNINGGRGGGVFVLDGNFIMKGGSISGNTVTEISGLLRTGQGGGVIMEGGTFTMEGGDISSNTATYIGGLYVRGGDFIMKGGTIRSNLATSPTSNNNLGLYIYSGVPQGTAVYGDGTPILEPGSTGTSVNLTGRN